MAVSKLFSTILNVFQEQGWAFAEVEGREVINAGFEAHHARVRLHVQAFPEWKAVSVVAESERTMSDSLKLERLAELCMRVNQTLTIGNFEINWDQGRMYFRATNLFVTERGNADIIAGLVHNTVAEMDRMSPLEAIIARTDGPGLAALDLAQLIAREDLIPEILPDAST